MSTKTFENEYGEKITVEVEENQIWVKHDDVNEGRQFLFEPIIKIEPGKIIAADRVELDGPDGTVVLKNGVILSSKEHDEILRVAIELGYEDRRGTNEEDPDR
jgi:hypothetical protein